MLDRNKLYDDYKDFINLNGSVVMRLTPEAAYNLCLKALDHGLMIDRIEGGFWRNGCFEMRLDCIWDSKPDKTPLENNQLAAEDILEEQAVHNAFIITTRKIEKEK